MAIRTLPPHTPEPVSSVRRRLAQVLALVLFATALATAGATSTASAQIGDNTALPDYARQLDPVCTETPGIDALAPTGALNWPVAADDTLGLTAGGQAASALFASVWDDFAALIPRAERPDLVQFVIENLPDGGAFVVRVDGDTFEWIVGFNYAFVCLPDANEYYAIMIHEFGHIMTLRETQSHGDDVDVEVCDATFNCSLPQSYLNQFFQRFWTDVYAEFQMTGDPAALYERYPSYFVSEYAATNVIEDIAETWTNFVMNPAPTGAERRHEKVAFFYEYPELVALRSVIRGNYPIPNAQPTTCEGNAVTVNLALGQAPTPNDDVILGTPGPDVIAAGAGNDIICGLGGDDIIWGQNGDDDIYGAAGADRIRGGAGDDFLFGGDGADDLNGGTGSDEVYGEAGDDVFVRGGTGDDIVDGGLGNDGLVAGNGGSDTVRGDAGNDRVTGGPRPDTVDGGAGNDEVKGNKGADQLNGGDGDDDVRGGPQPDTIDGGPGTDACNGGTTGQGAPEGDTAVACEGTLVNFP